MEEQEKLEKGVGTKEPEILKPAKVKIVKVRLEEVQFGNKTQEKVICSVKHPDREETIDISRIKVLKKDKLRSSGLWYKQDEEENIQKGTALADFLEFMKAENIKSLEGLELDTVAEDDGYLCFKAY